MIRSLGTAAGYGHCNAARGRLHHSLLIVAGYRYFKFMLFLCGFVIASITAYIVSYTQLSISPTSDRELAAVGIAVGAGLVGGITLIALFYVGMYVS